MRRLILVCATASTKMDLDWLRNVENANGMRRGAVLEMERGDEGGKREDLQTLLSLTKRRRRIALQDGFELDCFR